MKLIINSLSQKTKKFCFELFQTIYYLSILKQFYRKGKLQFYNQTFRVFLNSFYLSLQMITLVRIIVNRIRNWGLIKFPYNFYLTIIQNSEQAQSLIPSVPIYTSTPQILQEVYLPTLGYQQFRANILDEYDQYFDFDDFNQINRYDDIIQLSQIGELRFGNPFSYSYVSPWEELRQLSFVNYQVQEKSASLIWSKSLQRVFEQNDFNELDTLQNVFKELNTLHNVFKELKSLPHYSDKNVRRKSIR
ncbi:unnamed protein product (macronuclear) [Paramecium tetraurelia]|uniref:Transmembrane protein n=1 Tax=Paramecium tetraurelia TaxID=5888 RepID=A0BRH2_PARTE|nr:uncharacterized protein GSPATT00031370001 [Paramecium tetraurelia]CAK61139.1 unnamed protein product [Paramecium tetraurelia]|eukprot:XP_001428537.1 hypothetical protein (macronuclear) [Paramecium tetraurelia strain d4-2]